MGLLAFRPRTTLFSRIVVRHSRYSAYSLPGFSRGTFCQLKAAGHLGNIDGWTTTFDRNSPASLAWLYSTHLRTLAKRVRASRSRSSHPRSATIRTVRRDLMVAVAMRRLAENLAPNLLHLRADPPSFTHIATGTTLGVSPAASKASRVRGSGIRLIVTVPPSLARRARITGMAARGASSKLRRR